MSRGGRGAAAAAVGRRGRRRWATGGSAKAGSWATMCVAAAAAAAAAALIAAAAAAAAAALIAAAGPSPRFAACGRSRGGWWGAGAGPSVPLDPDNSDPSLLRSRRAARQAVRGAVRRQSCRGVAAQSPDRSPTSECMQG
jgi:hypothetical protein